MSKAQDAYHCVRCGKVKRGRFTRPRSGAIGSWTQGDSQTRDIPHWYCYSCLPLGEGRDEESQMPKAMQGEKVGVATRLPSTPTVNIEREHQKGLALANPIIQELGQLQITNEEEYLAADALLGRVRQSRKVWGSIWEQIQGRVIKPQREALEGVYFINREVDGPLEKGEKLLKSEMQLYKNEERRRLEQENRQRDAEAARTQQLIEEARTKLETARGSVKAILTRTVNRLETQQQVVMETTPLPVIGANSSTRQVKTIEVDNLQAFAVALTIGKLKDHPIRAAVTAAVNAVLKGEARTQEQKDIMAQWPGLKLVESTQIVGH